MHFVNLICSCKHTDLYLQRRESLSWSLKTSPWLPLLPSFFFLSLIPPSLHLSFHVRKNNSCFSLLFPPSPPGGVPSTFWVLQHLRTASLRSFAHISWGGSPVRKSSWLADHKPASSIVFSSLQPDAYSVLDLNNCISRTADPVMKCAPSLLLFLHDAAKPFQAGHVQIFPNFRVFTPDSLSDANKRRLDLDSNQRTDHCTTAPN